jgi:hypothetical protein
MDVRDAVIPIPYFADEIPREPVARLKEGLGAYDGEINLNHRRGCGGPAVAFGLAHHQYALDECDE